jgi:hypothetical protein
VTEKNKPARCIRSYRRIANSIYTCWNCEIPILPGDPYLGEVWVQGNKLYVKRFHDFCPLDPEEEEKRTREAVEVCNEVEARLNQIDQAA